MRPLGTALLLLMAPLLAAEMPLPGGRMECGFEASEARPRFSGLPVPRAFAVNESGFCSQYTYKGWDKTMHLYLGEGADEHIEWIRMAADLWNEALGTDGERPLVEIVTGHVPLNYSLPEGFGRSSKEEINRLKEDGQNVIYFRAFASDERTSWASNRTGGSQMMEADMYIDTSDVEEHGPLIYRIKEVYRHGESQSVFARVNKLYLTILHEMGHALGLRHIPVAGNVMSYRKLEGMVELWYPVYSLAFKLNPLDHDLSRMLSDREPRISYSWLHADWPNEFRKGQMDLYTRSYRLGDQDLAALMCIYDFDAWKR